MRVRVVLLVALALAGCQSRQTITPEAAGIFALAEDAGAGGSLVVDVDGLRSAGFVPKDAAKSGGLVLDLAVQALPAMAIGMKDDPMAAHLLRGAVLLGILREWNAWPDVLRFGVFAHGDATKLDDPSALADGVLVALATRADAAGNTEYLKGLAALDRANLKPQLTWKDERLCLASAELPVAVCAKAGPGYIVLGTAGAIGTLPPAGKASESSPLVRLRAGVPLLGKGELVVEGRDGLRLAVTVHADNAEVIAEFEKVANDALAKWDATNAEARTAVAPVLDQTKGVIAADAEAPGSLKKSASALTVTDLLDRGGHLSALRKSIRISRVGGDLNAEVSLSKEYLRELLDNSGGLMAGVAAAGVLGAIAIPNFVKFQCRSKQAEAQTSLRGLFTAQKAYFAEKDVYGTSFETIGFRPEPGNAYSYCLGSECLACTKEGCRKVSEEENPCSFHTALYGDPNAGFAGCAVADLDDDPYDFDVWVVDAEGEVRNVANDCD